MVKRYIVAKEEYSNPNAFGPLTYYLTCPFGSKGKWIEADGGPALFRWNSGILDYVFHFRTAADAKSFAQDFENSYVIEIESRWEVVGVV